MEEVYEMRNRILSKRVYGVKKLAENFGFWDKQKGLNPFIKAWNSENLWVNIFVKMLPDNARKAFACNQGKHHLMASLSPLLLEY